MSKCIIGIDPGTQVTGFGILKIESTVITPIDYGCIRPPSRAKLSDRYFIIYEGIKALLCKYSPDEMAIETPFVYKNPQGALKLGITLGMALIAAKECKMVVFGYSPREVKRSVTGTGRASKEQVQSTITKNLRLKVAPSPQDAADALAIALCHLQAHTLFKGRKEL